MATVVLDSGDANAILAQAFGHLILEAGALRAPCLCSIFAILFGFGHGASKVATEDAGTFFSGFLLEFVDHSDEEWQVWEAEFRACLKHGPEHLNFDMLKQFLMRRNTGARAAGLLVAALGPDKYSVLPTHKEHRAPSTQH